MLSRQQALRIAALSCGLSALLPAVAAAQGAPDASCAPLSTANAFTSGNNRFAQTFTAGISGELTAVQISLGMNMADVPADFSVRIGEVNGSGVPTDTVLASTTIPSASVPGGSSNLKVVAEFAQPAAVVAGQQYAFVVSKPGAGTTIRTEIRGGPAAACPGSLFLSMGQSGPFADLSADLVFTTFVTAPAPPDAQAPETAIGSGPAAKTRKRGATFSFSSDEADSSFECKLDAEAFAPCTSPKQYEKLKRGKHVFQVLAIDPVGNVDATPAAYEWKLKKKRKKKR